MTVPGDTRGLVGWWRLGEVDGDRAPDASGCGNHGRVIGPAACEGRDGRALRFTGGGDRVEVAAHPSLELRDELTIAAWVRRAAPNDSARWDAIVAKSPMAWAERPTDGPEWLAFEAAHPPVWDYELLTSKARTDELAFFANAGAPSEVYGGAPVPAGAWHHVAVTRRADRVAFYLDGTCTAEAAMTGTFARSGGPLVIGSDGSGPGGDLLGDLDEVLLFARGLGPAEVTALAGGR